MHGARMTSIGAAAAVALFAAAGPAAAADPVSLFKVVTTKDDVVIGVTADELQALGQGAEIEVVAKALDSRKFLVAWQYAPGRGPDGSAKELPIRRIAVFAGGLVRIEPYKAANEVVAPK